MNMGGSNFDLIMEKLLNQKKRMEELLEENHELHCQISDLREGRGIFVEILGQRFALIGEPVADPEAIVTTQDAPQVLDTVPEVTSSVAPETPLPATDPVEEDKKSAPVNTFLEEALLDEFATAAPSPMAVWTGSGSNPKQQTIDEDEKAALRRELMGSFLLE